MLPISFRETYFFHGKRVKICITDIRRFTSRKIMKFTFSIRMKLIETGFSDSIQFGAETVNDRAKSRASNFQSNADEARSTLKRGPR